MSPARPGSASRRWPRFAGGALLVLVAARPLGAQLAYGGNRPPLVGPTHGTLLLAGGGDLDPGIWRRFVDLAGGAEARIVTIPTAGTDEDLDQGWPGVEELHAAGARSVVVLHTRDRALADDESFVEPLREATGVWISGGRTWRLVDAYLDTRVHEELLALLDRGGIVGGSSAGASIQASFLMRGDPETNQTAFSPLYPQGFGFLDHAAVDQHLIARGRQGDLWQVLELHPDLLGIGLDEGTALIITGDSAQVVGASRVLVYDASGPRREQSWLEAGASFQLGTRTRVPSPAPTDAVPAC